MTPDQISEKHSTGTEQAINFFEGLISLKKDIEGLTNQIEAVNEHLKLLATRNAKDTAPIFITIDNECVGISGKYSDVVQFGLRKIEQDLRFDLAAKKLQLNKLIK